MVSILSMKRVSYLPKEQLHASKAWKIFNLPELDGTRKIMRLMFQAEKFLDDSPTAQLHALDNEEHSNLAGELPVNPQLHACIDCVRLVLEEKNNNSEDTAHPSKKIHSLNGAIYQSPMEKAAHIGLKYPELGELFTRYFKTHEKEVQFLDNNPEVRENAYNRAVTKNNNPYRDKYASQYTAAQLDMWR